MLPNNPGVTIPAPIPRYRTDTAVQDPTITDNAAKDAFSAVAQVTNGDIANLTIVFNLMEFTTERRLRLDEVLEREISLLVTQVTDR